MLIFIVLTYISVYGKSRNTQDYIILKSEER